MTVLRNNGSWVMPKEQAVKAPNIPYRGDRFFLMDFGIAEVVDASGTLVSSQWYVAPDVGCQESKPPKLIYGALESLTVMECKVGLKFDREGRLQFENRSMWSSHLRVTMKWKLLLHPLASMLAVEPSRHPTVGEYQSKLRRIVACELDEQIDTTMSPNL